MLDKYFGFLNVSDEYSVMETLIDHTKMDDKELKLLQKMVDNLTEPDLGIIEQLYLDIRNQCAHAKEVFKHTANQIINATFDQQKQYDLLRLFQRIESTSNLIIATAKRILILKRINATYPLDCLDLTKELMNETISLHELFKSALAQYIESKKKVIPIIENIEEKENKINHIRSQILQKLYKNANEGNLRMGDLRASENFIDHLEDTADSIEEASTSLEWLLIY